MYRLRLLRLFLNQLALSPNPKNFTYFLKCFKHYTYWLYFQKNRSKSPFTEGLPWMNFETILFLKQIIKPEFQIFEFGGGGSSKFFLNRCAFLHTTEHDKGWFEYILTELRAKPGQWEPQLILPETDIVQSFKSISNPLDYHSEVAEFKGKSFENYAKSILKYPENHFDLVLIDGRVRPSCIYHSLDKIKKGGYLCLDNSDRNYYTLDLEPLLKTSFNIIHSFYGPVPAASIFTEATIWQKV